MTYFQSLGTNAFQMSGKNAEDIDRKFTNQYNSNPGFSPRRQEYLHIHQSIMVREGQN